jgi:uncharacterized protein YciI
MLLSLLLVSLALAAAPGGPTAPATGASEKGPLGYEMSHYVVAFLYRGPSWSAEETPESAKIQEAHLANIQRLADEKKLLLAGPFTDGGDLRGLFVLDVPTVDEAKALCDTDPAVRAGRLRVELHPWYSAKGITFVQPDRHPPASH